MLSREEVFDLVLIRLIQKNSWVDLQLFRSDNKIKTDTITMNSIAKELIQNNWATWIVSMVTVRLTHEGKHHFAKYGNSYTNYSIEKAKMLKLKTIYEKEKEELIINNLKLENTHLKAGYFVVKYWWILLLLQLFISVISTIFVNWLQK